MSRATLDVLCCLPVLLLWLGPLALVVFCGVFGGCARIAALRRRPPAH